MSLIAALILAGCALEVPPPAEYPETGLGADATSPTGDWPSGSMGPDGGTSLPMDASPFEESDLDVIPSVTSMDARVIGDATTDVADANDLSSTDMGSEPQIGQQCRVNEYVFEGRCISCPPGTENDAGDRIGDGDTLCTVILCGQNQRVQDHLCHPCEDGTENAAGDPAADSDTQCDPIRCDVDERVQNRRCTPCPQDTTNAAGDRADGPDTSCDVDSCMMRRVVMNDVTLSGYAFRLMQGDTELAAQCDDDVYLSQNQVNELNQLLQQERGFDLSDDRLTVQWRFMVTTGNGPVNLQVAVAAGNDVRLVVSGMTVFLEGGTDTIRLDGASNHLELIYPAHLTADPPAIQMELRSL